ncbi:unnamed protein product [Camellia sinensis]
MCVKGFCEFGVVVMVGLSLFDVMVCIIIRSCSVFAVADDAIIVLIEREG